MYTWYEGLDKSPASRRMGPVIMGAGAFMMLCAVTCLLENKDEKNEHFIIGDCYNNFLFNRAHVEQLGCLPTVISTVQASLTQSDHDSLLQSLIESKGGLLQFKFL